MPDWITPDGGFTALDLDHLPDLPPRTELIDGSLVLLGPQPRFHSRAIQMLARAFRAAVPPRWDVNVAMSVMLGERQRPIPDIVIAEADVGDSATTWYPPEAVLLVVEVVSPESEIRDRERKPELYARAGIKHFWRVEEIEAPPVIYVFELDPGTGAYSPSGIYHGTLKTDVPFPIEIDLDAVRDR